MKTRWLFSLLLLMSAPYALGQSAGATTAPGYFDFDSVIGSGLKPKVQINLEEAMIGFLRAAAAAKKPEAASVLDGITNVRVYVFEDLDEKTVGDFRNRIDLAAGELEKKAWQRVVYVEDEGSKVRVYGLPSGAKMAGLTVMISGDSAEAVFINIVGDIDPVNLGRVAGALGVGGLIGDLGDIGMPAAETTAQEKTEDAG